MKEPLDERIEGMSKEEMITGLIEVPQKQASMLLEAGYLLMELGKNKEAEETFQGVAASCRIVKCRTWLSVTFIFRKASSINRLPNTGRLPS